MMFACFYKLKLRPIGLKILDSGTKGAFATWGCTTFRRGLLVVAITCTIRLLIEGTLQHIMKIFGNRQLDMVVEGSGTGPPVPQRFLRLCLALSNILVFRPKADFSLLCQLSPFSIFVPEACFLSLLKPKNRSLSPNLRLFAKFFL